MSSIKWSSITEWRSYNQSVVGEWCPSQEGSQHNTRTSTVNRFYQGKHDVVLLTLVLCVWGCLVVREINYEWNYSSDMTFFVIITFYKVWLGWFQSTRMGLVGHLFPEEERKCVQNVEASKEGATWEISFGLENNIRQEAIILWCNIWFSLLRIGPTGRLLCWGVNNHGWLCVLTCLWSWITVNCHLQNGVII